MSYSDSEALDVLGPALNELHARGLRWPWMFRWFGEKVIASMHTAMVGARDMALLMEVANKHGCEVSFYSLNPLYSEKVLQVEIGKTR